MTCAACEEATFDNAQNNFRLSGMSCVSDFCFLSSTKSQAAWWNLQSITGCVSLTLSDCQLKIGVDSLVLFVLHGEDPVALLFHGVLADTRAEIVDHNKSIG